MRSAVDPRSPETLGSGEHLGSATLLDLASGRRRTGSWPCRTHSHTAATLVFATLVCLPSCGGGAGTSPPADGSPSGSALSLAPIQRPLTEPEVRHFLRRTGFGATPEDYDNFDQADLAGWVDRMLTIEIGAPWETSADDEIRDPNRPRDYELIHWWLRLMTRNPNGFQEVLAMFWHDHFAASQRVLSSGGKHLYRQHIDRFRHDGMSNLRELLYGVIEDPAMLIWLDGVDNSAQAPNENLAREFFELFALGIDNGYTEADIVEASRALTGWRAVNDRNSGQTYVVFDPTRFDDGVKTVFGASGNFGARDIVDLALDRRGAAEFIAGELFKHFCYDDPPQFLCNQLGATLRANDFELRPVLRQILLSEAFFSPRSLRPRIKRPVDYVVGFVRSTGLELEFEDMHEHLDALAMLPSMPSNVSGWPEGVAWMTAHGMVSRGNALLDAITSRSHQGRIGVGLERILPPRAERTATQVVNRFVAVLGIQPEPGEVEEWAWYLNQHAFLENDELRTEEDLFDGTDPTHVDERARGLLFILSQHPSYHTR